MPRHLQRPDIADGSHCDGQQGERVEIDQARVEGEFGQGVYRRYDTTG